MRHVQNCSVSACNLNEDPCKATLGLGGIGRWHLRFQGGGDVRKMWQGDMGVGERTVEAPLWAMCFCVQCRIFPYPQVHILLPVVNYGSKNTK
jgi:hypothetical protein